MSAGGWDGHGVGMSMYNVPQPPAHPYPPSPPPVPGPGSRRWSPALIAGLVTAALGFVELSFSSYQSTNGVITECSYVNLGPWIFGPPALLCGLVALSRSARAGAAAGRERVLGAVCVAVGALHLLRAFEVVEVMSSSPC
jgi:hypothetical protein